MKNKIVIHSFIKSRQDKNNKQAAMTLRLNLIHLAVDFMTFFSFLGHFYESTFLHGRQKQTIFM